MAHRFRTSLAVVWLVASMGPLAAEELFSPLSTKIWDDFSVNNVATKAHQALGYATVTLGATAFVLDLRGSPDAVFLNQAAAVSAGTTLLAGLVAHWGDLSFEGDVLTWHNLHAATAVVGASVMLASPFVPASTRWGFLSTALLAIAIVWEG